MASSPLSQATGDVQGIINQASDALQNARTLKEQMHESQKNIISQWQGAASTRYRANADSLHDDLTNAVERLQAIIDQGHANVRSLASVDNG